MEVQKVVMEVEEDSLVSLSRPEIVGPHVFMNLISIRS